MSLIKKYRELEQRCAQAENLAAVRLTVIMLLVQRAGGRVPVARADLAAMQGWTLRSIDDGDEMTLLAEPPVGAVPEATDLDQAFGSIGRAVKRGLKN